MQNSFSLTFPGQTESFSLTNLYMRNINVSFQSLTITLETRNKGGETNLKVEIQIIICERSEQEKFWTVVRNLQFFSASLLTSAPWYFKIPRLSLILWLSTTFPDFPDGRNHGRCYKHYVSGEGTGAFLNRFMEKCWKNVIWRELVYWLNPMLNILGKYWQQKFCRLIMKKKTLKTQKINCSV